MSRFFMVHCVYIHYKIIMQFRLMHHSLTPFATDTDRQTAFDSLYY